MSWYTDSHGRRIPRSQKTIFAPGRNVEAMEHIHIDTPANAQKSIDWLNSEWNSRGREGRVDLVQYANQAASRAGIIGDNKRVSPPQRDEARRVSSIFRTWTDVHKGKE